MSRVDLLIFGASGFTGKYTVKEIIKIAKAKNYNFTWGVAGRNKQKLMNTLKEMTKGEEIDVEKIPIFIADINNEDSLNEMAKQAKVILNCCGPYRFYGEPVVKACIENKTHHVDVSGELEYMETMQVRYHEKAKENEVYVVSACGFDSIPADMGIVYFKDQFNGEVNSVEVFVESWVSGANKGGSTIHYGTWESAVYEFAAKDKLQSIRKQLFPKKDLFHQLTPKLQHRFPISKSQVIGGKWCFPFPGSDLSVMKRSQYFFYEHDRERPVQVGSYIAFPNFLAALIVMMCVIGFTIMSQFSLGRQLLLKYPKLCSFNYASHEGPSEEKAENTFFSMTFCGDGWKEKLAEPLDKHVDEPNKKLVTKVSARNPGYGATCIFLIMSGLMMLEESEKMPDRGGVYPPGAAFSKTNMISRLKEAGIKFEVLE